jgi:hypothetical protein
LLSRGIGGGIESGNERCLFLLYINFPKLMP